MRMHSVRFKITAIAVVAILVAFLAIFAASYSIVQSENDRRSVEIMSLINEDTKSTLDAYFIGIEQSVKMAANMAIDSLDGVVLVECGAAGSYADQNPQTAEQKVRLDAYIAEHCKLVLQTFESVASHTNGIVSYYYCITPEISQTEHGFFFTRIGKAGFAEQAPLDAAALDPENQEANAWYFTTISRGRPSWIGPYPAESLHGMLTCSYLVPIYSAGTLVGVLGMDIPLDTLVANVSSIRVYKTGFASLCDAEGRIYYHPSMAYGTLPELGKVSVPGEMLYQRDSGDTLIRYTIDGVTRQMAFTTLRNGMKLVTTAPLKEINASWLRLVRIVSIITAVVIVLMAVIILFGMRIVTFPLLRLTAASQRLANADYDVALDYRSEDEIGMLTKAFVKMRDQLKAYIEDLSRRANTDMLTGLPNMRSFFKLASAERERLLAEGKSPSVLFFDLYGMKHYNRQYGFDEGDKLLCDIGQILADEYGENRICRFSEDHFAALSDEERLEERLEDVFKKCEQANNGNSQPVRAGIYLDSIEPVSISIACDRAKYACDKQKGTYMSGFRYFDEAMLRQLDGVRYIINHLDQALEEHWIKVYYQPIVRSVNSRVCDEEALSRWVDPVRGMLSPAVFIPILENAHLIYKLDLYVLDQILEKMKAQQKVGLHVVPHSLNLSRADFDVCDIVEEIRRRVDEAGIARDRLTIEVTESIIGSDFDFMKTQIERFQALGFQVWMDDFGSGYSSLDVLQDIHFDLLKFDMRFMKRFGEGDESKIILSNLIRMAVDLQVETVCEGVETAEEVAFLKEAGCSKLQGFYFCKPVPYEEILERNRKGIQIGFENPAETEYYSAIGRVNLDDLTVLAGHEELFNRLPVGIMEVRGDEVRYLRFNQAFRDYMGNYFRFDLNEAKTYLANPSGPDGAFMDSVRRCCADGNRAFFDGTLADGSAVHAIINRIDVNPVNGATALVVAIVSVDLPEAAAPGKGGRA